MSWMLALALTILLFMAWGFGIGFIAHELGKQEIRERSKWASIQGTIISSKDSYRPDRGDCESGYSSEDWVITVQFSYEVEGTSYSGKQKWSTRNWPGDQYRPRDNVAVYYNPAKPEEAVVRPDEPSGEGEGCLIWATGIPVIVLIIWIWSLT